jgi:acid phosphatase type 7
MDGSHFDTLVRILTLAGARRRSQPDPASKTTRRAWLHTLLLLAVVVTIVLGSALWGIGTAPAWFPRDGMSSAGVMAPIEEHLTVGEQGESAFDAAAKGKGDKQDKGDKQGKAKHKGGKQGKPKGNKNAKHRGGKQGKHKGDKQNGRSPDGQLTAAAAGSLTVRPVADARVEEANPTTNYGTSGLRVDGNADPDVESYLRFEVSGVTDTVRQATLRLWVPAGGGTANGPAVFRAPNTWTEAGLTWANRPAATGTALDNKAAIPEGAWVAYTVTAAVSGNGTFNFVLKPESGDGANFHSREGANPPQLIVEFGSAPTATTTPTRTPTPTPTPNTNGDPVVMAAGDNVCGADSTGANCRQVATSDLLVTANPKAVLVLGDVQYECGEASDFTSFYDPSWGRVKARTHPAVGNHEYRTSTDPAHACFGNPARAQAYFSYFGAAAGDPAKGYYSFDIGAWHLIALNSNCSFVGGCGVGSPQEKWLRADLAAHPTKCTLAYWHAPLYSSGGRATTATKALYQALFDANADLILTGHDHTYERFAPQNANTQADNVRGIRQFVVGTGGRNLTSWGTIAANSEVRNNTTFGVLKLTLHPGSYDWQFVPIAGQSFTDTGTTACH